MHRNAYVLEVILLTSFERDKNVEEESVGSSGSGVGGGRYFW